MNHIKSSAHFSSILLAAIALAVSAPLTYAQTYRVTDLGVINTQTGQMISHAAGINNAGQVAGYSFSGTDLHAARFTNGLVEDLGTIPGGDKSYGVGINDLGQVVGDSQYDSVNGCCRHAALFSNGTVTDLGFLPGWGNYSRATAINQAGEVVGYSGPTNPTASPSPTQTRAFIWDATNGMRDLGTLGGAGYSKALSINNSGLVTGESRTATGGGTHAFIWDATGGMRDIGTIAGDFSVGNSINANGHVAGKSSINTFDNRDHAFFYDGTTMQDLGSLGTGHFFSDRSVAYGINIHDHVVGGTYRLYTGGALYGIPFIYRDGQMLDLTTLVDASGNDYQLGYATGINDAGQIAIDQSIKRSTNEIHAVLLTPNGTSTPTPTPTPTPIPTPTSTPCGPPTNFANTTPISIPATGTSGIAAPYPSNIVVAALAGNVAQVTVKLNNFNHSFPDDVDILLVGPGGQNAIILSDVGGAPDAVSVTLTLDDTAISNLPDATALISGTFKPTNFTGTGTETFSAPAPAPSGGSALSVFNGTNPNGTWSLYVMDDQSTDAGGLAGGWELNITTDNCGSSTPTPAPTATPGATPTPMPINISGTISYCSNPVPGPVPSVTLTLTGTMSGSTLSDGSGNYQFSSLAVGGSYTVTPTKAALTPGSPGITTVDVVATQRHFLNIAPLPPGCRLTAADVDLNSLVNTVDVIAIQRFFLGLTTGIAQTGKYKFTPVSRSYMPLVSNQTGQDYDTLVYGDVASAFVESVDGPSPTAADEGTSAGEVAATVAALSLPDVAVDAFVTNFIVQVTTTTINAGDNLVGFQGDFTFDERVVAFQSEPVRKAGITGGDWNVSGNVLPGAGPIRTLRISAYSNDFTALSGLGTLFELRMTRVSQAAQSTQLLWAAPPDQFIFIDADLKTQEPGNATPGSVTPSVKRR